jgi:hypothetical protein
MSDSSLSILIGFLLFRRCKHPSLTKLLPPKGAFLRLTRPALETDWVFGDNKDPALATKRELHLILPRSLLRYSCIHEETV